MTLFEAIILGLVQGLAEFLPISSSGHLALLQYFFGIEGESVLLFAVLLHVGTLVSLIMVYYKDLGELFVELGATLKDIFTGKGPRIDANPNRKLGFLIIVATIPTALIGVFFNDLFNGFYLSLMAIGIGLLFTGTLLWIAERIPEGKKNVRKTKFRDAIFVGIMQGIAICPGVSRSGSTLFGGLAAGLNRETAVKFAFLISIPSILGAVVLEVPDALKLGLGDNMLVPVLVGMAVAAVSGFIAIKTMIKVVSNKKLIYFSIYTWLLGALVIAYTIFIQ